MSIENLELSEKSEKVSFAMIGGGWRAEFYLRIAKEMTDKFEVCGIVVRSAEKGMAIEKEWGIKTFRTVGELLKHKSPTFVVVSVPSQATPGYLTEIAANGVPAITETPPAQDVDALAQLTALVSRGAKIQVAEQYHLQPLHAARIAIARSGKLGEISQARLSVCHGYHAVSLMRKFLDVGFRNCTISAREFRSKIVEGPGQRSGPRRENIILSRQVIAQLDFGDKLGIYDFDDEQYFSWIRSLNLQVRGSRGQISDTTVKYLLDFATPVEYDLKRLNAGENGNLEGYYLKGIMAGESWIYRNPFTPAKLTDDELAIASCLDKMNVYSKGGPEFYSLADAAQDHYLSLMINKAVASGEAVSTQSQIWAG